MAVIGADLTVETLRGLQAGAIHPRLQDQTKATLAPILRKEDGRIDFHLTAREIRNRLRGFKPWPGAYTSFRGKNLNLWEAHVVEGTRADVSPGELKVDGERLLVGCGGGTVLEIIELQPEGKKRMGARDFINGY